MSVRAISRVIHTISWWVAMAGLVMGLYLLGDGYVKRSLAIGLAAVSALALVTIHAIRLEHWRGLGRVRSKFTHLR